MTHTPCRVVRPVVDGDVVDAEDTTQVYPPGGGTFFVIRNDTLSGPDTEIRF